MLEMLAEVAPRYAAPLYVTHWICVTCGAQYAERPSHRRAASSARTSASTSAIRASAGRRSPSSAASTRNTVEPSRTRADRDSPREPRFAIGQQAHLIETPAGNVLWNCITLVDDDTVAAIERRGGLAAIAVSHPHFFTGVAEWSRAFGGVPVFLHGDDRAWVTRPDDAIGFWEGDTADPPGSGLTLIRCGGHFPGGCVLHWAAGAGGAGALLTGDTIQVVADRRWVSFMESYPNLIPLGADANRRIVAAVEPYAFDRLYGAWWGRVVPADAKERACGASAARYVRWIGADLAGS